VSITWEQAREIVRAAAEREGLGGGMPWDVADYGAEDATAWLVPHGPPAHLDGTDVSVGGWEGDGVTLVGKDSGRVAWFPWLADGIMKRVAAMTKFGTWPD